MAAATVNIPAVIYEYVTTSGTDIYTSIGSRFWPEVLRDTWTQDNAAIVFMIDGGSWVDGTPIADMSFSVRIYGGAASGKAPTQTECWTVYRELHDRLHEVNMQTVSSGMLMSCREVAVGQMLIDPDLEIPYIVARYSAQIRND